MKKLLLCLVIAVSPALLFAQDAAKPKAEKHSHEETPLGETMDKLNGAWRKLRRQAADAAQNPASLELLATVKAAAEKSLTFTPDLAKDIPADKRDKFIAAYQAKMKETIAAFNKLEAFLKAGDNAAAVDLIAKIATMQKEGHKEFKRPE
jgi:vacuolar-type H+-ATPase subunit E/Vma4